MTYTQTLQRMEEIQCLLAAGTGDRGRLAQELMGLKVKMTRFPEHKKNKGEKHGTTDS